MARKLIVEIVGDATQLTRSFNQSTTAANKFGAEVSGSMGKAEKSFTALQRVAAGGFIGGAAARAGIAAVKDTTAGRIRPRRADVARTSGVRRPGRRSRGFGRRRQPTAFGFADSGA